MSYSKDELVKYRLSRAKEAFVDVQILFSNERWNAAANRMYYACFYIVSAYLSCKGLKATTHSGLKTIFNKKLIKTGKIDKEDGKLFNKLFGLRQIADYDDFYVISKIEIEHLIPKIEILISQIEQIIELEK